MSHAISALMFLDSKGKPVLFRDYRGDIPLKVSEDFMAKLSEMEENGRVSPVIQDDQVSYIYIQYSNLYLLALSRNNSNAVAILAFLHKLVNIFKHYFRELEEESLRDNFVIAYELLDEVMDFGYPQFTEAQILSEYIKVDAYKMAVQARPPMAVTNAVSWRTEGIHYKKNEVFLDVVESVNLLVNSNGTVVRSEVVGALKMRTYLSGMPECKLGLNDKVLFEAQGRGGRQKAVDLEDMKFHQCVRLASFERDRTISFIPPDGAFDLMTYRLSQNVRPLIWVECQVEKHSRSRTEYLVKAKSQFKDRSTATSVEIMLPLPPDAISPVVRTSQGNATYAPEKDALVWKIKNFPGGREFMLRCKFGLPSVEAEEETKGRMPPIKVKFEIPYFTVSGMQVRYLKVIERSGYQALPWEAGSWEGATAIVVPAGGAAEDIRYWKSSSLYLWLLGYEFTDTILVFTKEEVHALAGSKKTEILKQLEGAIQEMGKTLHLHIKPKKEDGSEQMQALLDVVKASGNPAITGSFPKEKPTGAFAESWSKLVAESGLQAVDVSASVGSILSPKDEDEVKNVKKAAFLLSKALTTRAIKDIEETIDQEKKVKHSKIADQLEAVISDPAKIAVKLKAEFVDVAYPPLVQSGGEYDLKLSAGSNDKIMHYGVILCQAGARYASYCANVGRTFFVNPTPQQEAEYAALVEAQAAAIAALVEGAKMSAAYDAALQVLKDKGQTALVEKFPKNIGSAIGLELRDNTHALHASNDKVVKPGMTFNVSLGVTGLTLTGDVTDAAKKNYAMLLADTIVTKADGATPDNATAIAPKVWKDVAYYVNDDEEASEGGEEEEEEEDGAAATEVLGIRKSARTEQVDFKAREDERRRQKENQEELLERVNQTTLQMLTKAGTSDGGAAGAGRKITDLTAYRSINDMQHNNMLAVQVDHKSECVLVPMYGMLVPFHILTIKNATNNQDNEHAYIRINFNYGASSEPGAKFPQAVFVKELSFRTADVRHAAKVVQEIKTLRSQIQQREKEKVERATLVKQEKLVRGKGRVFSLPDVWVRPAFGGKGRKVAGTLEAHSNGFRYTSPKGEELDIMYRNVKHAFYQPAENEMITLVHFHLHNPIMVGKKKTSDVQFYAEVMDTVQTLDAGRRSMYDPDEIEEEQRERERRNQINRQFQQFVKRVQQDIWERDFGDLNLDFEIPFRELGFFGVPARSTSFIVPTVNCLVELTEMPFTVITLSEVNLVNLERVGFNLRNFDMIFIWKDLNRDVARIDTIPSQSLETIKDWMTSIELKFYESKVNLNWKNILKSIKEDPEDFVENGGWNFLDADQSDSEDDEEGESEFEPSEAEADEAGESDEDSSEDESVVESDDDDDSEYGLDSDEEEGLDWDELEAHARREDKHREFSDEEEPKAKRKHQGGSSGGHKKSRR